MIQRIHQWLLLPFPFEKQWSRAFRSGFWAGAFVTFFLFFFKPFGVRISPGKEWAYLGICALFGLVTIFMSLIINGLTRLFPRVFDEEIWRIWKEILFNVFFIGCIGAGNLLLVHFLWQAPLDARAFATWQALTFAVGVFPSLFGAYVGQVKMNRRYAAEAARISQQVHAHPDAAHSPVVLTGDNQQDTLQLDTAMILYLSAADNYVQVFYLENGRPVKRMIRATMKKMEEALAAHPQFFRCHRTYIVNLEKVENVSGNAQGYRLHLGGTGDSIPVSRNLNETLRSKLDKI